MKRFVTAVGLVALVALCGAAQAQPPAGQWYFLHQEVAKPSQVALYESTTKEFVALVQANRVAMPTFNFDVFQGDDFTYTYAMPIQGFATADKVFAEFGALFQAAGAKFADLTKRSSPAVDHYAEMIVGHEPAMSYVAAAPRLKMEDAKFFHFSFYYLIAGKEEDAKALAGDFVALMKSKNVPDSYNIYMAVTGPDMPLLVVEQWARDEADYWASEAKNNATLGDAVGALNARALGLTRRIEHKNAWIRPDLSLMAPLKK